MNDDELRQVMAALDAYNAQLEALERQVRLLQASLEEVTIARESLKAISAAKEGDDILVPVGASSYVPAKVSGNKKVIVGIGNRLSVEKSHDEAIALMESNREDISEALKKTLSALENVENAASELTAAVQNEYQNRQIQ